MLGEYIAAYIDNGYEGLKTNGGGSDKDIYGSRNSKYKTVYENDDIDKSTKLLSRIFK